MGRASLGPLALLAWVASRAGGPKHFESQNISNHMLGLNINYIFVCLFIYFDIYLIIYVFLNDVLSLVLRD